ADLGSGGARGPPPRREAGWARLVRMTIVRTLAVQGECNCGAVPLEITKSTATHHWRVLREAGVIHQRLDGRATMTRLRRDDLDARFPGLLDTVLAVRPRILEGVSGMLPD
ncbi:MAG TPA: helix-turn-helix domain-containing protein, partial [Streptosporangiaceae bacterium]|nr:helix-turn-helix domain-containing protein [Streptosporangiaceae bacterium]